MDAIRILLVDDDARIREALHDLLVDAGFEIVGAAENAREAIDMAERLRPDVVVMDIQLPGMSGIDATREVLSRVPTTKVIVLSAYADEALVSGARDAGAIHYIVKGTPPVQICDTIRRIAGDES